MKKKDVIDMLIDTVHGSQESKTTIGCMFCELIDNVHRDGQLTDYQATSFYITKREWSNIMRATKT